MNNLKDIIEYISSINLVTISTWIIFIGTPLRLVLSDKLEMIFFNKINKILRSITEIVLLDIVIAAIILLISYTLSFKNVSNGTIKLFEKIFYIVINMVSIVTVILMYSNLSKQKSKRLEDYFTIAIIFSIVGLGVLILLEDKKLGYELYNRIEFTVYLSLMPSLYIKLLGISSKGRESSYWINYKDDNGKIDKYYIFFATDKEFVLCAKNSVYRENNKFKYIKIRDIKENYEINFDKDKNSKNTVDYKFRKKVTYGRTNTKNKKI